MILDCYLLCYSNQKTHFVCYIHNILMDVLSNLRGISNRTIYSILVSKMFSFWFSRRCRQVTKRLLNFKWYELSHLSMENRMRTICPHVSNKELGSKFWKVDWVWKPTLDEGWKEGTTAKNILRLRNKMSILILRAKHLTQNIFYYNVGMLRW